MDPLSTCDLFGQFLTERRYLKNVAPSTIEWYQTAFKASIAAQHSWLKLFQLRFVLPVLSRLQSTCGVRRVPRC